LIVNTNSSPQVDLQNANYHTRRRKQAAAVQSMSGRYGRWVCGLYEPQR